ncbi:MAG: hypothetical protein IH858_07020 [Chloroflexi bacterium]|nr:hypothetical protein [Chloroflexota bacterium]
MTTSPSVSITLKRGVQFFLLAFVVLLAFHLVALFLIHVIHYDDAPRFVDFFHFSYEDNAPTLYSVLLILVGAAACFAVSRQDVPDQKYWLALSIIFSYLALDELVSIHERVGVLIELTFSTSGFFHNAWIIPGAILVVILAIFFLGWLRRLPRRIALGFTMSAVLYLTGVIFLEGLEGWWVSNIGRDLAYDLIVTVEESLEMLGVITFSYFALKYLLAESDGNQVELRLVDG